MKLSPAQQTVSADPSRFRCLVAGRRFGKSFLSINEIAKFAHLPQKNVGYWAPTRQMAKTILWDELKTRLTAVRWVANINESELTIKLRNGSKIFLRSADNPDASRGLSLDAAVLDEAQDIDPRMITEIIRPALADRQGAMLVIGTPKGIGNHLYDIYTDKSFKSWQYTTAQGGRVAEEELALAKEMLDSRTYKQEFEASFETYAGVIYLEFGNHNLRELRPADATENLLLLCDFNISPMSPRNPFTAFPDPAGVQRKTSAGGNTDITILQNAGYKVLYKPRHPQVIDRIAAVNSLLKDQGLATRLLIDPKCKRLIESLKKQCFKEGTRIPDKDEGWDHSNDALGYGVDYMFPITRTKDDERNPDYWSRF
jgi:hypothetical protein